MRLMHDDRGVLVTPRLLLPQRLLRMLSHMPLNRRQPLRLPLNGAVEVPPHVHDL